MAVLYGTLERVKRELFIDTGDISEDTLLTQILDDTSDFINLKLKNAGVADPETSISTDRTIDRIASQIAAAHFRRARHHDQREFGPGIRGGVTSSALDFALMELQMWVNMKLSLGRSQAGTFEIVRIDGEGMRGPDDPLDA